MESKRSKNNGQQAETGFFLVIEGSDGSGKATQAELLRNRLIEQNREVQTLDLPQYDKGSSYFIRRYLKGEYGSLEEIDGYQASLFFSLERFDLKKSIEETLLKKGVVLSNRFTASNLAHQGAKIKKKEDRRAYFDWLEQMEFGLLKIPRPDLNLVLMVRPEISQQLIKERNQAKDIHEDNFDYLRDTYRVYDELCAAKPEEFLKIDCCPEEEILPVGQIAQTILVHLKGLRPDIFAD